MIVIGELLNCQESSVSQQVAPAVSRRANIPDLTSASVEFGIFSLLERHRLGKVAAWSGGHAWRQNSLSRPCLAESNACREPRHDDDRRDLHDALQRDGEKIAVRQLADPGAVRVVPLQLQTD